MMFGVAGTYSEGMQCLRAEPSYVEDATGKLLHMLGEEILETQSLPCCQRTSGTNQKPGFALSIPF